MSRTALVPANRAAASAPAVSVVDLVSIEFPSGLVYLAAGDRDIAFGGNTYAASGALIATGAAEEGGDLKPRTTTLVFSGVDRGLLAKIRGEQWQFGKVNVFLGFLDDAGNLVAEPYRLAPEMRASTGSISLAPGVASLTLDIETEDVYMLRNAAVLATDASQRSRSPGDTGLSKVVQISDLTIQWGGQSRSVGSAGVTGLLGHLGGNVSPSPETPRSGALFSYRGRG